MDFGGVGGHGRLLGVRFVSESFVDMASGSHVAFWNSRHTLQYSTEKGSEETQNGIVSLLDGADTRKDRQRLFVRGTWFYKCKRTARTGAEKRTGHTQ
jgi:hypothetical protein